MKKGLKKIVGKITEGDEYGIYRQNDEGYQYLMFAVSTYREAMIYGPAIAKLLGVAFLDYLPVPEKPEPDEEGGGDPYFAGIMGGEVKDSVIPKDGKLKVKPKDQTEGYLDLIAGRKISNYDPHNPQHLRPKPKRVSGVAKAVKPMIEAGKTDEAIFQTMLPLYLEAGRTEKEARELILSYVKDIRAGKY